jgi:Prokaryotic RING finger family 1
MADEPATPARTVTRCPSCGKAFAVSAETVGKRARCPACHEPFTITTVPHGQATGRADHSPDAAAPSAGATGRAAAETLCAICQSPCEPGEPTVACPACRSVYHADCWEYNQGCAQYGCEQAPPTEKLQDLEMPASYWGAEEKACPNCGKVIKAAAVRCRFCGTTFESARPQEAHQFEARQQVKSRAPAVRTQGIWLLVFSLLTCTAPIAAVVGAFWYVANRQVIASLPPMSSALCKIAVGVAWLQSIIVVLVAVFHSLMAGA